MSGIDYIGADELVFNNDTNLGIHSGGFSINSILLKGGMSPIVTINNQQSGGNFNKVSDLFNDLVVPNWALSYNNRIVGGKYKEVEEDSDDDVIEDDLHNKLLELVRENNPKGSLKKRTRKNTDVKNKDFKKKLTRKRK